MAAGGLLGVVGAFYHLLTLDVVGLGLPVLLPVLLGALAALAFGGARFCGRRLGAVLPAGGWLLVTLLLAEPRAEGDVVLTGGVTSLAYLLAGTLVAGTAVGLGAVRGVGKVEE